MAEQKPINAVLKQFLELGPPILYFIVYLRIRDDTYAIGGTEYSGLILAAVGFVPLLLIANAILWKLTGEISKMQIFIAVTVIFFTSLTVWFNDERFFKMKTSIVYASFGSLLGVGLLRGKSYLKFVMGDFMKMKKQGWMILSRNLMLAFFAMAVANEVVWRGMSTDFWVKFETFGLPLALMVFLWWQIFALQKYVIEDTPDA